MSHGADQERNRRFLTHDQRRESTFTGSERFLLTPNRKHMSSRRAPNPASKGIPMTARENDLRTQCLDNIFTGKRTTRALLSSRVKRVFGAVAAVAALTATLGWSAAPAGAGVTATNDKFCAVVSGDQGLGIDFSGLGRDEAKYAAGLSRKAAKTGVPAKLKTDLTKLAKVYDQIAHGASSNKVVADEQAFIVSALTRFGKYLAANCIATAPST